VRVPVAASLLLLIVVASACTTTSTSVVGGSDAPALEPEGGVAIFPISSATEGMASCVARIAQRRLSRARVVAGSDALALAFGADAGSAGAFPDPLPPAPRDRLRAAGIRYVVTVAGETGTTFEGAGVVLYLWTLSWRRISEVRAAIYETGSGKGVKLVRALAQGPVGFVAVVVPLVPFFAFTQSHACKAVGDGLSDALGGAPPRP
jgi:hypothetical protein